VAVVAEVMVTPQGYQRGTRPPRGGLRLCGASRATRDGRGGRRSVVRRLGVGHILKEKRIAVKKNHTKRILQQNSLLAQHWARVLYKKKRKYSARHGSFAP